MTIQINYNEIKLIFNMWLYVHFSNFNNQNICTGDLVERQLCYITTNERNKEWVAISRDWDELRVIHRRVSYRLIKRLIDFIQQVSRRLGVAYTLCILSYYCTNMEFSFSYNIGSWHSSHSNAAVNIAVNFW